MNAYTYDRAAYLHFCLQGECDDEPTEYARDDDDIEDIYPATQDEGEE